MFIVCQMHLTDNEEDLSGKFKGDYFKGDLSKFTKKILNTYDHLPYNGRGHQKCRDRRQSAFPVISTNTNSAGIADVKRTQVYFQNGCI